MPSSLMSNGKRGHRPLRGGIVGRILLLSIVCEPPFRYLPPWGALANQDLLRNINKCGAFGGCRDFTAGCGVACW